MVATLFDDSGEILGNLKELRLMTFWTGREKAMHEKRVQKLCLLGVDSKGEIRV
jgi:hypothetical protein